MSVHTCLGLVVVFFWRISFLLNVFYLYFTIRARVKSSNLSVFGKVTEIFVKDRQSFKKREFFLQKVLLF